jgi:hypothetical protein
MRRIQVFAIIPLILIVLAFADSQSRQTNPQITERASVAQPNPIERQASTQQRINRYFHGAIVPKLRRCWSTIDGKGTITLKYTFTKAGANWTFNRLETAQSTLAHGQATLAERCMLNAVQGTSFALDVLERNQNTFVLNWTWPVPLPANAAKLTSEMFAAKPIGGGTGSGGCDGWGTAASCYTCKGPKCETVCVGSTECRSVDVGGGQTCASQGKCASGGPFSVVGGSPIIY